MRRRDADAATLAGRADPFGSKTPGPRTWRRGLGLACPVSPPGPGTGSGPSATRTLTARAAPARPPAALGAISAPPSAPGPLTGRPPRGGVGVTSGRMRSRALATAGAESYRRGALVPLETEPGLGGGGTARPLEKPRCRLRARAKGKARTKTSFLRSKENPRWGPLPGFGPGPQGLADWHLAARSPGSEDSWHCSEIPKCTPY